MWVPSPANRPANTSKSPREVSDDPEDASRMLPLKSPLIAQPPPGKAATDLTVAVLLLTKSPKFLPHWQVIGEPVKSRIMPSKPVPDGDRPQRVSNVVAVLISPTTAMCVPLTATPKMPSEPGSSLRSAAAPLEVAART